MEDCVFCQIASGEMDADIVLENEHGIVFPDINPKAPVHLLVIPRKHIASLEDAKDEHRELLGSLLLLARRAAGEAGVASSGYKLATNVGEGAGQVVHHLHFHLLGGWDGKPDSLGV